MELENRQFRIGKDPFSEFQFDIIIKRSPWHHWWIHKDQLDALIEILTQLKEEIDGKDGIRL